MIKILKKLSLLLLILLFSANAYAVIGAKGASCLTGGTTGCLDSFDGSTLNDGDIAIVQVSDVFYFYILDSTSAATESSPKVISPDSSAGNKRWLLKGIFHDPTHTVLANDATPSIAAGNLFYTGGTTAITDFDDGYAGKIITIIAAHSVKITYNANIALTGDADYDMTSGDTLMLVCSNAGVWHELSRAVLTVVPPAGP